MKSKYMSSILIAEVSCNYKEEMKIKRGAKSFICYCGMEFAELEFRKRL